MAERVKPPRVKNVAVRLYVDKFREHRETYEFLVSQQEMHGDASRTLVRALVHYQNTVLKPLAELEARNHRNGSRSLQLEQLAYRAFHPVPSDERHVPGRVKHVAVRLYVDKFVEHRVAFEAISSQEHMHGEGLKTIVRALLHYRDSTLGR